MASRDFTFYLHFEQTGPAFLHGESLHKACRCLPRDEAANHVPCEPSTSGQSPLSTHTATDTLQVAILSHTSRAIHTAFA